MRKILNLIKCEFIKNYTFKKCLLVLLFLLFSVSVFTEFNLSFSNYQYDSKDLPFRDSTMLAYYQKEVKENPTLENKFYLNYYKKEYIMYQKIEELNIVNQESWQYKVLSRIFELEQDLFLIDALLENPNITYGDKRNEFRKSLDRVYEEYDEESNDLEMLKMNKQKLKSEWEELIRENKYYKYLEYHLEKVDELGEDKFEQIYGSIFNEELRNRNFYQKMIAEKVEEENNYVSLNIHQLSHIYIGEVMDEKEYNQRKTYYDFPNYKSYVRYENEMIRYKKEQVAILNYGIKHNTAHDITYSNEDNVYTHQYTTSKHLVNSVFHFSIIVMLLVVLTSSGIVSSEHNKKTDKALLTTSISRGKILFSKFLYLILHAYIIWLAIFIIFFFYVGIRYGFHDLFTSKLVYFNGSVHEVNYILWTLKDMIVYSIPIIAMISIMFMLSTVTLSTTITVGITSIATVISAVLWHFIYKYKLFFLAYTPIPYLDFLTVKNHQENYLKTLRKINVLPEVGFLVCIIFVIICYSISHFIYVRRDIKN